MARNSNRTNVTIKPEDVGTVNLDKVVLHIYSGNIEGYAETDMELPRDNTPIRKPYGYKPGSLSVVRRKLQKVAPVLLEGEEAKVSTGITTRLAELAKNLGAFFTGTSK